MKLFTRKELDALRKTLKAQRDGAPSDGAALERLLDHAAFALDAALLLRQLEEIPVEPYTDAAALQKRIVDAHNELWNRYLA